MPKKKRGDVVENLPPESKDELSNRGVRLITGGNVLYLDCNYIEFVDVARKTFGLWGDKLINFIVQECGLTVRKWKAHINIFLEPYNRVAIVSGVGWIAMYAGALDELPYELRRLATKTKWFEWSQALVWDNFIRFAKYFKISPKQLARAIGLKDNEYNMLRGIHCSRCLLEKIAAGLGVSPYRLGNSVLTLEDIAEVYTGARVGWGGAKFLPVDKAVLLARAGAFRYAAVPKAGGYYLYLTRDAELYFAFDRGVLNMIRKLQARKGVELEIKVCRNRVEALEWIIPLQDKLREALLEEELP